MSNWTIFKRCPRASIGIGNLHKMQVTVTQTQTLSDMVAHQAFAEISQLVPDAFQVQIRRTVWQWDVLYDLIELNIYKYTT